MTLILDMETGEEYRGEEMSCPRAVVTIPARSDSLQVQHPQLQLAMVEATPPQHKRSIDMAGIDIETLIKSIEN
ncbi:MAG: hypothetical protein BMS9Abin06_0113 [Gammaproteobacteria bacterium]|nr:MAG: hypothetical protein BMS9Abin06_0113 [Gammaproteobacteria bacterium]